ncbi:DNA mismatch repair endonuclease MutL [Marinilabilia rubra]|uniref:DNA mismatch repair protein MutL n=1 Tax=Marinilabilia rubra TaxID=2162893 RepID=A0A2U2BD77_9BACT|nr:DNA mismatch repair endonuclease MutL [Marinilabilia rubra]PWE01019.1 DNA mismatch repair endonuclease MutL [Marinilabilia rubra]
MSDIIQLLPDSVANQIAAGEVIQRPASVIKELVENAVDAGSTDIKVIVKDAGRTLVQIIDNGCGMSETDARMAFERHATSKIRNANDLFAIRTMGFRGEALASIAAVAQLELKTRPHEQELGTKIEISGSKVENQEPVTCAPGSNFMIRNLFFNVPARRRFLKTNATELRHIVNEFQRIALANPDVTFSLNHNEQVLFNLPTTNLKQRIAGVMGKNSNAQLIPVETETSVINIHGFIGKPQAAKKTMGDQFFFINNRYMRSPYLHKAVTSAYENLIQADHCPPYFLFFEADPSIIDVNIHPTKTEIKFEDERSVWKIVSASVREALGKFNMVPSIDFDQTDGIEIPTFRKDEPVAVPSVSINPDYNPFEPESTRPSTSRTSSSPVSSNWESLYEGFETSGDDFWRDDEPEAVILPSRENMEEPESIKQVTLPSSEGSDRTETGTLYFQIKNKYIITSVKSGIMIIDQRRAHERILFEDFLKNIQSGASVSQQSLFPEEVSFSEEDAILLREINQDLRIFGFELQEHDNCTFAITGQPSFIKNVNATKLIDAILDAFKSGEVDPENEIKEQLAAIMARNACMRPGEVLSQSEMAELINKLFLCTAPNYTPSGKTVFSILDNEELDKRFR